MITCHRKHLEARCRERGYTLDQVMACVVSQDGDVWVIDPQHPSYPKAGLGDRVEKALKTVGITEERVSKLIGRPCGCPERKKALNRLGRRLGLG